MIFIENNNLLAVFDLIQKTLSVPLARTVIESRRKPTHDYVDKILPGAVKTVIRVASFGPVVSNLTALGNAFGLGNVRLIDMRIKGEEGDFVKLGIANPFFIPFFCGMVAGTMEDVSGHQSSVSYQETSPGRYEVTTFVSSHPVELAGRLHLHEYAVKAVDVELEECPGCGGLTSWPITASTSRPGPSTARPVAAA